MTFSSSSFLLSFSSQNVGSCMNKIAINNSIHKKEPLSDFSFRQFKISVQIYLKNMKFLDTMKYWLKANSFYYTEVYFRRKTALVGGCEWWLLNEPITQRYWGRTSLLFWTKKEFFSLFSIASVFDVLLTLLWLNNMIFCAFCFTILWIIVTTSEAARKTEAMATLGEGN